MKSKDTEKSQIVFELWLLSNTSSHMGWFTKETWLIMVYPLIVLHVYEYSTQPLPGIRLLFKDLSSMIWLVTADF